MLVRVLNPFLSPVPLNKDTHTGTFSVLGSDWEVTDEHYPNEDVEKTVNANIKELFDLDGIEQTRKQQLLGLLKEFDDVIIKGVHDLARTTVVHHQIHTGDAPPIRQGPRLLPFHKREIEEQEVQKTLDQELISPCTSPWCNVLYMTGSEIKH